jgi:hypothetical protein
MNLVVRFCFYALPMGIALLGGCGKDRTSTGSGVAHIAKIKVKRDGVIVLNNDTVTLEQLKTSLSKLSQSAGSAVWYYRENPAGEPHPNAMLVLQAIVEAKLPVKLSTKPDFSDFLGPDGASDPPR